MRSCRLDIVWWVLVLYACLITRVALIDAEETPQQGKRTLPGERCRVSPRDAWTPQEGWVWRQVCEGTIADFNTTDRYGGTLDPQKPESWPANRILRPTFLETMLLHEPWRSAVSRQGVRIRGAWFKETLDLANAELSHELWLDDSRFDKTVRLSRLRTPHLISFDGSTVTGQLNMDNLHVGSALFMGDGATFAEVNLQSAQIEDQLDMTQATVTGQLDMDSLHVGSSLFLRDGATFAEVILRGAQIEGQLDMTQATVTGPLNMDGLHVGSSLFLRDGDLTKAPSIDIIFATIGTNLDLRGSQGLPSLDLTGTTIGGELRLTWDSSAPTWQPNAQLTLRNTKAGALQETRPETDAMEAWPPKLELGGFTYDRLGGLAAQEAHDMARRDASWFKRWLEKQHPYAPQPYEQLAKVLRDAGYAEKATAILYASKRREHRETRWWPPTWVGLTLERLFIGYGYYNFWVLWWVLLFCVMGVVVLRWSGQEEPKPTLPQLIYSIDMLLPIIELDKAHEKITLHGWPKWYFYVHKAAGFLLGTFFLAGLSGLTKH